MIRKSFSKPEMVCPPILIKNVRFWLENHQCSNTKRERIERLCRSLERADDVAMAIRGKHPGNPNWMKAVVLATGFIKQLQNEIKE